ncbi:glycosyltransferase [Marivita sp. GX14005]|uniref:glycosyltransferase n=1 Tax=Marivita sp. GX14005 TaxID=2942276 RepID=UPI0020199869|nr:glycosyltransferase [Marivita sp. GX14005]MCL3883973.1 glycosyltransferase [Marivita sp. GX14005]
MLHRLLRLYHRYCHHHLRVEFAPGVTLERGRVTVACAEAVALIHGGACAQSPLPLSLPHDPRAGIRVSRRNGDLFCPALPRWRMACHHVALWPGLLRRAAHVLPLLPRAAAPRIRAEAKRRLGLDAAPPAPPLRPLPAPAALPQGKPEIAIILPVHNAAALTMACLDRIEENTDLPWRLVVVEDGSTDPALRPALRGRVARIPRASLICHESPRGFAGAVNAALDRLAGFAGPVVLLNSDVTLPQGWASRLIAPLRADGSIASVTPLSNDGELMGAPHACAAVSLRKGEADAIDAGLRIHTRGADLPSLPTGTGFCMALGPHWLREVPRLDESYGRGYGEEVDWCQRTRALGGRHVCQTGLFVGHVGAASFGANARQDLRARSAPLLARRWPRFERDVAQWLAADPLAGERLRAGLLWARARLGKAPLPVYLAHSLGGGVARWLEQRLADHEAALVLRVGGPLRWQVELHSAGGVTRGASESLAAIKALLAHAGPREVVYACAVGDPAPEEIPHVLLDLCAGGQGLEILFHDYFPLNRDYTFLSEPCRDWQALWRPALARADHLTVFSESSAGIVAGVHPDLAGRIRLRPHRPLAEVPRLSPPPEGRMVIGVPGDLGAHKGAQVVADLARVLARTGEARLVVLGQVAPDCALPRGVKVLGGYELSDLPHLVARHRIGAWLIPSLWPETFSYVTHEALATGLPTFGFDLGGQGDALRADPAGRVVSLRKDGSADLEALLQGLRALPGWPDRALKSDPVPAQNGVLAGAEA